MQDRYGGATLQVGTLVYLATFLVAAGLPDSSKPVNKKVSQGKFVAGSLIMFSLFLFLLPLLWRLIPNFGIIPKTSLDHLRPYYPMIAMATHGLDYFLRYSGILLLAQLPVHQYDFDYDAHATPKAYLIYLAATFRHSLIYPAATLKQLKQI